jgi:GT2 family glycosyltransferase
MYFDDVDYCRRLWTAGWSVLATPDVVVRHRVGRGSGATAALPADGGSSPLRYFAKHLPDRERERATRWLLRGWRIRAVAHGVAGLWGRPASAAKSARFRVALSEARSR